MNTDTRMKALPQQNSNKRQAPSYITASAVAVVSLIMSAFYTSAQDILTQAVTLPCSFVYGNSIYFYY